MLRTSRRWLAWSLAVVPMMWCASATFGQANQTQDRQNRDQAQGQRTQGQQIRGQQDQDAAGQGFRGQIGEGITDQELVSWLLVDNQAEVQMGQLAQKQAANPQVKQFAQQMVQDHQQFAQKLQQAAGGGAGLPGQSGAQNRQSGAAGQQVAQNRTTTQPATTPQTGQAQPGQPQQRTALRPVQGQAIGAAGGGLAAFHQQVGQKVLKAKQQMLQEKQGAQFDVAYMSDQVAAHVCAVASMEIAQQYAQSPQLKQTLQQGVQTTKHHLKEAIALLQQVEQRDDNAANTNRGQRQNNRGTQQDQQ